MNIDSIGTRLGHDESTGKVIRPVTVCLLVDVSRFAGQEDVVCAVVREIQKIGEITQISLEPPLNLHFSKKYCSVCRWIHDAAFTQIKVSRDKVISLGGVLPDIVAAVHRAHENGLPALSTKDAELLRILGSYRHPSKAFDDLKHRDDYKILFIRRRGFISLRAASGINPE